MKTIKCPKCSQEISEVEREVCTCPRCNQTLVIVGGPAFLDLRQGDSRVKLPESRAGWGNSEKK